MTLNLRNHTVLFLFLFVLVMALTFGSVSVHAESRAYQLANRPGDDVASQIKELYQDESVSITARGQQLVVRGNSQLLDEIGTLIETLDVAQAQLRITVRSTGNIGGKRSGAGVTTTGNNVGVTVERQVTSTGGSKERSLMVMDGQSAHITSGQVRTLPFAVRGGRNPAAIFEQIETHSGFVVSPQVISDRAIELNITSFEADPAELDGYETQALVTIRRVEPGQWVPLGSTSTQSTSKNSGIAYRVESSRSDNRQFEVKVEVVH
ncbi:MAG: secretin [Marinobacter sp.]|uniref:secretin n=1 Tax=Marinobacter sp. TaxID=50741 RepID=UPI003F9CA3E5